VKVSILIPHKPRPGSDERLARAINSALNQTHNDIEVIVKAHNARPSFRWGAYVLNDERVTWIDGPDNSITHAVNIAAQRSTGDVMHFACDDDEMTPDAVASALEALRPRSRQWTYGAMHIVRYEAGERRLVEGNGGWVWDKGRLLHENFIPQPTVFWKRDAWNAVGPFDESLRFCLDYEMWGRLGSLYEPRVRRHIDSYYEQWDHSTTATQQAAMWTEVGIIQARWRTHGLGWRPRGVQSAG